MSKRIQKWIISILLFVSLLGCSGINNKSPFSIKFIDVGQGDAALIECDGHFMLIDGGDINSGQTIYDELKNKNINNLDVLVVSHLHKDHYGGLIKGLDYVNKINLTLINDDEGEGESNYLKFNSKINNLSNIIKIPNENYEFELGSAKVRILYSDIKRDNDSLILMVEYGKTGFLFMGDTPQETESEILSSFNEEYQALLFKVGHHGSQYSTSIRFLDTLKAQSKKLYAIISTNGKIYGHPHSNTLSRLEQAKVEYYRTDFDGSITVKSNGKKIYIEKTNK